MQIEPLCRSSKTDTWLSSIGKVAHFHFGNLAHFREEIPHVLAAEGSTFQQKAINTLKTDGGITDAQIKTLQDAMIQK